MTWHELTVSGQIARQAMERYARAARRVTLELDSDALPPYTWQMEGMWFISVSLTGLGETKDSPLVDAPDEPMTSISYTGVVAGTDLPVRIEYFGEVLVAFYVEVG